MKMDGGVAGALFSPRSIALVGASSDPSKHTSLPLQYLAQHGYTGRIFPINPNRKTIGDLLCHPSVAAVGETIDQAFIMLPASMVPAAIRDCASAGVRVAVILSAGFSEVGEQGQRLQEEMLAEARRGGVRLVGPNSLGMVNFVDGVAVTANEVFSIPTLPKGRLALVTQSGSLLGALVSRAAGRSIGFSKMVSVGNEADLGVGEIGAMLVEDDDTDAILLFLETVRDADCMRAMAIRAHEKGKPIIAFRLGRSAVGEKLAMSHTGALSSDGAAIDAFLADVGIMRVDQIETLLEAPALVTGCKPARGGRVAVMSTTGGGGGLVVDALAERNVDVVAPDRAFIDLVAGRGITISDSPLIDLTLAGARADRYGAVLEALLDSPHCDAVVAVVGSSAEFRPDRAVQPIIDLSHRIGKPLAVFITPQAEESHRRLRAAGVATFRSPETCADALSAALRRRPPVIRARKGEAIPMPDLSGFGAGQLPLEASLKVAAAFGAPPPAGVTIPAMDAYMAEDMPIRLSYPAVAKIVSSDIPHKTEAGGVIIGARSAVELAEACGAMVRRVRQRRPDAVLEAVRIEAQETGLAEAIVGFRIDPAVGPIITVGAGGVLAEIYRDIVLRPAPVDRQEAMEMIGEVRAFAAIRGYRSLPLGDVEALAAVVVSMSRLACVENARVIEAEINPVLVKPEGEGVVALDALFVIGDHAP
ncbi:MAG: acetate--CoA ligase family protein [Aquamicrobium sp.]|uniref:acetate--CoA ligase family protein n=1 Tax=Aquamicrobium sp. TaxID=1872579 RepID=UPI00349E71C4|nr:acetate--CoA ligase family protein [Aquamicrobium sp.]